MNTDRRSQRKTRTDTDRNAGGTSELCNSYQDGRVTCENPTCRVVLSWDGNGRPPLFCSGACKQAVYRVRKHSNDVQAARLAEQHRQEATLRKLADAFAVQLSGGRMSQTQVKEMSVRLAGIAVGHLGQGRML